MAHDRDPRPVGKWRQVTEVLYSQAECRSWADHIEALGESEAKVMRQPNHCGRAGWAVFAKRKEEKCRRRK